MQRLRIRFSRGNELKFISHLDIIRLWDRALRRAQIPLAYSEGFSPHPRISLAAPLSVGVISDAELMDLTVANQVSPHWFAAAVSQQLPAGMGIGDVYPIATAIPSLQSQVCFAEYEVDVETDTGIAGIKADISRVLEAATLPWHHYRDTGRRDYDLRTLIDDIWLVEQQPGGYRLGMRLRCDSNGSGRPEQVAAVLGYAEHPRLIRRTQLILGARIRPDTRK